MPKMIIIYYFEKTSQESYAGYSLCFNTKIESIGYCSCNLKWVL